MTLGELKEKSFLFVLNFEENLVQKNDYLILVFIIFIERLKLFPSHNFYVYYDS